MANPNIVNVATINGVTTYTALANTSATVLLANAAASGQVYKLNSLVVSNVSTSAAAITVAINTLAAGTGTSYRLAYQISVPVGSTLVVIDKNNTIYLQEDKSIVVTAGTASALEVVLSYESIA